MTTRHIKDPLPRKFAGVEGLLLEKDLRVGKSRLRAKLVVFEKPKHLRSFWKHHIPAKGDLGSKTLGAVNGLAHTMISWDTERPDLGETETMYVDPYYFCIIGLTVGNLSMEIVCHESVHAGFNYAKRIRRDMWSNSLQLDEENVCYPAGIIASHINRVIYKAGLYK